MLAIGFKLPHLALHVPYKFYEMYQGRNQSWALNDNERTFPGDTTPLSYRCCAEQNMMYMQDEGEIRTADTEYLAGPDQINRTISSRMRNELMMGYAAGISFVDSQLGRVLDALEELSLWNNGEQSKYRQPVVYCLTNCMSHILFSFHILMNSHNRVDC